LDHDFFRSNRLANRIEILPFQEKNVAQGADDGSPEAKIKFLRLISQKLGLKQGASYQVVWKKHPSKKLVALLSKQPKKQKQPKVFSKMNKVVFLDAALVDRTTNRDKKTYHYRPSELNVTTRKFYPSDRSDYNVAEIKGYFDAFEKEIGNNILIIDLSEELLDNALLDFTVDLRTPDQKNNTFHLQLVLKGEERTEFQCNSLYYYDICEAVLNLEKHDRDLIAFWKDQSRRKK